MKAIFISIYFSGIMTVIEATIEVVIVEVAIETGVGVLIAMNHQGTEEVSIEVRMKLI